MDRLKNKKVFVGKYSREILEKCKELGFKFEFEHIRDIPFLIFDVYFKIVNHTVHTEHFYNHPFEEVTPEYILSLKDETKPKWEDFGEISGYFVSGHSKAEYYFNYSSFEDNANTFPTKEEAEACIALSQLLQWRDKYNEGWKPDWTDYDNPKYIIEYNEDEIELDVYESVQRVLAFRTAEIRDKFLEDFRELIEQAKPLL